MTAAWGRGLATITDDGTVLDTWFRELGLGDEPQPEAFEAYTTAQRRDDTRRVSVRAVQVRIDTDDARSFAGSLSLPYCGVNAGFEAARWLDDPAAVMSIAMLPLRHGAEPNAFGLLVLGSPDPTRYSADMGTEFLMRIADIASAALSRLLPLG